MSSPAENIRLARIRAGLEPDEVARAAGLNKPSYFDVEGDDEEVTGNVSLRALTAIARAVGTTVVKLLEGPDAPGVGRHHSAAALADMVRARISAQSLTVEAYSDRLGWNITPVLAEPQNLWEYPLVMLHALCDDLAVDWREVVAT